MRRNNDNHTNTVVTVISGKWTLPVITVLQKDTLRYSAIQKSIPGITQRALTMTLQKLERNGVIVRTSHPTIPPQVEYKLTPLGLELLELSEAMTVWAKKYAAEIKHAQKKYNHSAKKVTAPVS